MSKRWLWTLLLSVASVTPCPAQNPRQDQTARTNKELIRRVYDEVFARWNLALLDEVVSPERESGTPTGTVRSRHVTEKLEGHQRAGTKRDVGGVDGTPMRPVVVKPRVFSVFEAHFRRGRRADPPAPRAGSAQAAGASKNVKRSGHAAGVPGDPQELAASSRRSAVAPTLLLSVSMRCTEHQKLMREAWERAPLLELGLTSVNPSCRRALAPARWPPPRDRSVVPQTSIGFNRAPSGTVPVSR